MTDAAKEYRDEWAGGTPGGYRLKPTVDHQITRDHPDGTAEHRHTFRGPGWRLDVVTPLSPVPVRHEPDPVWRHVDPAGHAHAYDAAGNVPTCIPRRETRYDYDGESYEAEWLACLECGAKVVPGTRPLPGPRYDPGRPWVQGTATLPDSLALSFDLVALSDMEAADLIPVPGGVRGRVRVVSGEGTFPARKPARVAVEFVGSEVEVDLAALFAATGHQDFTDESGRVTSTWLTT